MKKIILISALALGLPLLISAQSVKTGLVPSGTTVKQSNPATNNTSTSTTTTTPQPGTPGTHAGPPTTSTRPVSEPYVPKYVSVNKTINDYGTIQKGADPYCQFDITNNTNQPLVIKTAYGSCGCTVPEYPKDPLPPGKTVTMKVRYDTQRIGAFIKKVFVQFEGHDDEKLELVIKGTVETPPADMPFGTQPVGTGAPLENH